MIIHDSNFLLQISHQDSRVAVRPNYQFEVQGSTETHLQQ